MVRRVGGALEGMPEWAVLASGFALVGAIWAAEYRTGPEIGVSIFFIIPIALVVWRVGGAWAVVMPVVSAAAWLAGELAAGVTYSHWEMGLWRALIRLGFFLIFSMLITMRRHFVMEKSARQAAEDASRLKSNMVALVSHEYANALTNMKLAMSLLRQSEAAPPPPRESAYGVLERSIEHLGLATKNFLDLNRLQSGHLRLNIRRVRMRSAAAETLRLLNPIIAGKRLRLDLDFPRTPVSIRADPEALSVIMSNLVTNAVKYTPSGGSISVRI
ncbi:MAG: HAMP domain-containing sensor histidine kinase, partial [Elusimicrobia bacterium]|nr:HAMP domain-containing sensor histidine kinase [Elusimicrobiota bacterium]